MKTKKIPLRTCVISHEKLAKEYLFRIVKNNNNEVFIDYSMKANGRGAYLKKDLEVIKKAKITKVLNRKLEIEVPDSIYDELEEKLHNNK